MAYTVVVLVYCSKHAMPNSVHAEAGVGEYTLPVARFCKYTHTLTKHAYIQKVIKKKALRPAHILSPAMEIILNSLISDKTTCKSTGGFFLLSGDYVYRESLKTEGKTKENVGAF